MKAAIILNEEAGHGNSLKEKFKNFDDERLSTKIFAVKGNNLVHIVDNIGKNDFDIFIAAGGDGTIRSVAEKAVKLNRILGIIPAGTLNHFARDAGIPLNVNGAIEVIKKAKTDLIDTAEVNRHIFINNSSIGLYPTVVKKREKQIKLGGNKWAAMFKATLALFKSIPRIEIAIKAEGKTVKCKTPFVFIGNNDYKMDLFNLGRRAGLKDGRLSIYYPNYGGRISYFRLIIKMLLGKLDQERHFQILHSEEITIYSRKNIVEVSIDGEVIRLNTPLHYKINPGSLKLIIKD